MISVSVKNLCKMFMVSVIAFCCWQLEAFDFNSFLAYLKNPRANNKRLALHYEQRNDGLSQGYAEVRGTENRCFFFTSKEINELHEFMRAHKAFIHLDSCLVWGTCEKECCIEVYRIEASS